MVFSMSLSSCPPGFRAEGKWKCRGCQPYSQMHINQCYIIVCQTKTNTRQPCSQLHISRRYITICQTKTNTKTKTTIQPDAHQPILHHCLSNKDKYKDKDKDNHVASCTPTDITSLFVRQRQIHRQRQRYPHCQMHIN